MYARLTFALIIAAAFLDIIDFSIIQIALPTIREEFQISLSDAQWIVGAYGLTLAGFLFLSGRAGDIYGQKKLFIIGVAMFTVASLLGGLSPTLITLVVARSVQGIGAAISTVTALAIFATIFPEGPRRNRALGIFVAILSAGFAAGSILGGVLTAAFGWRSVMFVNVPIGAATVGLAYKYLQGTRDAKKRGHLDLLGGSTATVGILLFVYALTDIANNGFVSFLTFIPLIVAILVLVAFIIIEAKSKEPLVPLTFLHRGSVLTANIITLIIAAASGGLGFIVTVYMQQILGYSALSTGLAFLPSALVFLVAGGWGSSRLVNRFGEKTVLLMALAFVIAGNALLTQISEVGSLAVLELGTILWGLGASIGFPALYIVALADTRKGEEGLASGIITTSQRVGFPLGLAVLVTIATVISAQSMASMGTPDSVTPVVLGFRYAFLAGTIMSVVGFAFALFIRRVNGASRQ